MAGPVQDQKTLKRQLTEAQTAFDLFLKKIEAIETKQQELLKDIRHHLDQAKIKDILQRIKK